MSDAPPQAVLDAFSVRESPARLAGGEGRAFCAGDVVLKPVDDETEAAWVAELLRDLDGGNRFRVPRPIRTAAGGWVADGWSAWERLEGAHVPARWREVLAAGDAFHAAVERVPEPRFMRARQTPWAVGDRVAWGEQAAPRLPAAFMRLLSPLVACCRPLVAGRQVIHGDLCGNVLFADGRPPAIIDCAPYFRPTSYARAIVAFDAVTWEGADAELFEAVADDDREQLLVRAAIFRLTAGGLLARLDPRRGGAHEIAPYERTIRMLTASR